MAAPQESSASRFVWAGWGVTLAVSLLFLWMGWARFHTVHNRTFDLAFYSRLAWGLAVFDGWDPMQHANVLGLHLSVVLVPLGWLGRLFGTVPVLLTAQVAAVGGAGLVLGKLAVRHLGPLGGLTAPIAWLAYPNLSHVVSYEWHPGTLAVLPLAWAMERLDARDARGTVLASLGVLACREDLALVTALLGLLVAWPARARGPEPHASVVRFGLALAAGSLAYLALFAFVLHPRFAPPGGSFDAHFGHLGSTASEALANLVTDPGRLVEHVDAHKLSWLPRVLAPMAFLPLLAPRLLLPALPVLAVAFFSAFHTTANLDSHYLTTALPPLLAAGIVGAGKLRAPLRATAPSVLAAAAMFGWALAGQGPDDPAFAADRQTLVRRIALDAVPPDASVQAPDPLLAHLAERARVHRGWRRDHGADVLILDLSHRDRYAGREVLLRTSEEPIMRRRLADPGWGVVSHAHPYVVLERGADPRGIATDYLVGQQHAPEGRMLTDCLRLVRARRSDGRAELELHATGPCPADLAIRIDDRVDLLFDGWLSPAHLRAGDRLRSAHRADGPAIRVSLLRSSGAPPNPGDPTLTVPLQSVREP